MDIKVRENFHVFGVATFLYACLYAFCLYQNNSGITYPVFVIGGLVFIGYCMHHLGITIKKGTVFYVVSLILLGISTFCTDDSRIIIFNKIGVFLLMLAMVLYNVFETKSWGIGKYISAIFQSIFMAIGELIYPVVDSIWFCKNKMGQKSKMILYVGISLIVSVPVFAIVLVLLVSADAVFGNMTASLLKDISIYNIFGVSFKIVIMFWWAYGIISFLSRKSIKEEVVESGKGNSLLAIPMVAILSALYLVFSIVQIAGLFLGKMQLPEGYTYAMYAREGFFQLLAVSILNLIIVLVGIHFFQKSKILNVLLTIMSLCTFIMIASSAMRMILYIQTYHLTFLRLFVLWSLLLLTILFIGVIFNLYNKQFPLFRYSMVVVTVCYLALSFSHPDYWIAKYNLENMEHITISDYQYLCDLSADAAPVLVSYLGEEKAKEFWQDGDMSFRKFNLSRYIANSLF